MSNEPDLVSLQKKADDIDRELSMELAKENGRTKRLSRHRTFPVGSWIFTIIIFGVWAFGSALEQFFPFDQYRIWIFLFGCASGLFSIFFTLMWLKSLAKGKGAAEAIKETPRAAELKAKRDALRARIAEYKEKHRV